MHDHHLTSRQWKFVPRSPIPAHAPSTVPSPAELVEVEPWHDDARCRTADPELFAPHRDGERLNGPPARAFTAAARYCAHCPVLDDCDRAAERRRDVGTWAGKWRTGHAGANRGRPIPLSATTAA